MRADAFAFLRRALTCGVVACVMSLWLGFGVTAAADPADETTQASAEAVSAEGEGTADAEAAGVHPDALSLADSAGGQGDGGSSGAVVDVEESDAAQGGSGKAPSAIANAVGSAAASSEPAGEDPAAGQSESEKPRPLISEGNQVNPGQVFDNSFLYDTDIADLASADLFYDGQTVRIMGEVVGEPIRGFGNNSGYYWIAVNDLNSDSTITVVVKESDLKKIDTYGAYGKTGTIVRIIGTFNLVCSTHEGESDVHAMQVTAVEEGSVHPDELNLETFVPALFMLGLGLLMTFLFFWARERSR